MPDEWLLLDSSGREITVDGVRLRFTCPRRARLAALELETIGLAVAAVAPTMLGPAPLASEGPLSPRLS